MSFERIKNFWRGNSDTKGDDSIFQQAQNLISVTLRKSPPNTLEFEEYLTKLPQSHRKSKTNNKSTGSTSTTLKPQLLKRCYQIVDQRYFKNEYQITQEFFIRSKKINLQRQIKIQQDLDQVQICLFNQISSRFDQILSVLRTIQSLQCIVQDNRQKLHKIRLVNLKKTKQISIKQLKVSKLITRKKNIQQKIQYLKKIKYYNDFKKFQEQCIQIIDQKSFYSSIKQIKDYSQIFRKLSCINNIDQRIQQFQSLLKKSFSDNINDSLFRYITQIIPYQKNFWSKMSYKFDIFEDDRKDNDGTVILDESIIIQQQQQRVKVQLIIERQENILENFKRGWIDGQYTVGSLKAKIDSFLRNLHNNFIQDFRNFCLEICQRFQKQVQNPNLSNLLNLMTINFVTKVCQYFIDLHKNLLQRLFSLVNRCINYIINQSYKQKTIQQKQKLNNMFEGLTNTQAFIFKIITDKINQLIDLKIIYQTTDLIQFKTLISVLQYQQQFIDKRLTQLTTYQYKQQCFLKQKIQLIINRLNLQVIKKNKQQKILSYLLKMHKFVLESELRDNLQNQIWQPVDIPTFYYDSLHYLISGQSLNLRRNRYNRQNVSFNGSMMFQSSVLMDYVPKDCSYNRDMTKSTIGNFRIIRNQIIIQGKTYKITQTILLIIQILQDYLNLAQSYPSIRKQAAFKIGQLLRSYNSSSCQLIIHAGAVALGKIKSKNITARNLALSSLCLSFILYLIECILKRSQIYQQKKLIKDITQHMNDTIKKLNTILVNKVSQSLININLQNSPSKGTQDIIGNTKRLHDILIDYYQKNTLKLVFTKDIIKLYVNKLSTLTIQDKIGAQSLKDDISFYFNQLRFLEDIIPEYGELRIQAQDIVRKAFQSL